MNILNTLLDHEKSFFKHRHVYTPLQYICKITPEETNTSVFDTQVYSGPTDPDKSHAYRFTAEHVSGAERGASGERSVRNIVGARSGFLSKGRSDRSVLLRFCSNTAHTTSLGHAQIHPEFTCAFNN